MDNHLKNMERPERAAGRNMIRKAWDWLCDMVNMLEEKDQALCNDLHAALDPVTPLMIPNYEAFPWC